MDKNEQDSSLESLEDQQTVVSGNDSVITPGPGESKPQPEGEKKPDKPKRRAGSPVQWIALHLNVYFLMFILLLVVAGGAIFVTYTTDKKSQTQQGTVEELTEKDLEALQSTATKIGDPKSTLNVESNAIFSGKVLVRDSLDVAGTIKVGGALSLPGITVSGTSQFDDVRINNLSISGDTSVLGTLTVQKTLNVTGGATFGGTISAPQLNIDKLQISGDLLINRHVDTGGATPGISFGGALGGGGTASVSGSDTAGTLTVNTGGGAPAGCFATINFVNKFNSTPRVVVTPNDIDAAALDVYVTRSTSNFSVCTVSNPPDGVNFGFDYIALE